MNRSTWILPAVAVLVIAGVFAGLQAAGLQLTDITPDRVRTFVLSFGVWAPTMYLLLYAQPIVPVPASLMMISAGLAFGSVWGTCASLAGATMRASLQFVIARRFGRKPIEACLKGRIAALDQQIGRNGFRAVMLVRLVPNFPFDIQNYGLGCSKVRFVPFFWGTFFGLIPGTLAFVCLGYSLTDPKQLWKLALAILLILAIIFLPRRWKPRECASPRP